jgi:putative DNA primase/helicase
VARAPRSPAALSTDSAAGGAAGISEEWQALSEVRAREVRWLLPDRIPLHCLSLIEARKGLGKSTLCAAIAAHVTGGRPLPGCRRQPADSRVLWLAGEESAERDVLPRIQAAGGDPRAVFLPSPDPATGVRRRLTLPASYESLDSLVRAGRVTLIVADPYVSCVAAGYCVRDEDAVRALLEPLAEWCSLRRVTLLATRHVRKGRGGDALDAGLGSVAVGNVARSILRLDAHPIDTGTYTLARVRANYGKTPPTLTYRLVGDSDCLPHIEWIGETDLDADDLASVDQDAGERDERVDAVAVLRGILHDGPRPARDVLTEATEAGVSLRTLRRAKAELGVLSLRKVVGAKAYLEWQRPVERDPPAVPPAGRPRPKRPRPKRPRPKPSRNGIDHATTPGAS